jgi:hypothetical protein
VRRLALAALLVATGAPAVSLAASAPHQRLCALAVQTNAVATSLGRLEGVEQRKARAIKERDAAKGTHLALVEREALSRLRHDVDRAGGDMKAVGRDQAPRSEKAARLERLRAQAIEHLTNTIDSQGMANELFLVDMLAIQKHDLGHVQEASRVAQLVHRADAETTAGVRALLNYRNLAGASDAGC